MSSKAAYPLVRSSAVFKVTLAALLPKIKFLAFSPAWPARLPRLLAAFHAPLTPALANLNPDLRVELIGCKGLNATPLRASLAILPLEKLGNEPGFLNPAKVVRKLLAIPDANPPTKVLPDSNLAYSLDLTNW